MTIKTTICDRCKRKIYKHQMPKTIFAKNKRYTLINKYIDNEYKYMYELCDECARKLENFLYGKADIYINEENRSKD